MTNFDILTKLAGLNNALGYKYYEFHCGVQDLKELHECYSGDFQFYHADKYEQWDKIDIANIKCRINKYTKAIQALHKHYKDCLTEICESNKMALFVEQLRNTLSICDDTINDIDFCDKHIAIEYGVLTFKLRVEVEILYIHASTILNSINNNQLFNEEPTNTPQPEEPQQTTPITQESKTLEEVFKKFPQLNTPKAQKYFNRAIEKGYIRLSSNGLKWESKEIRLGYFCFNIFEKPRPCNQIDKCFDVNKISAQITQAECKKMYISDARSDVKEWINQMDNDIFFD